MKNTISRLMTALIVASCIATSAHATETVKIVAATTGGWSSINLLPTMCKKYDLNVDVSKVDPKMATTSLLIAQSKGEIDLVGPSLAATLQSVVNGNETYIFSNLSSSGIALIARKDSGIKSLADLKGKKVASMRGSSPETLFQMSLEKLKLTAAGDGTGDVTLVPMSITLMEQAVTLGNVDAAVTALPESNKALTNGSADVIKVYTDMHRLLVANKSFGGERAVKLSKCLDDVYALLQNKNRTKEQDAQIAAAGVIMPNGTNEYVWTRHYPQQNLENFVAYLSRSGKLPIDFKVPNQFNRTLGLK